VHTCVTDDIILCVWQQRSLLSVYHTIETYNRIPKGCFGFVVLKYVPKGREQSFGVDGT
jgi:hypothetical protein